MRCAVTRNVGSLVCVTMGAIKMSSQLHVVGTYICTCAGVQIVCVCVWCVFVSVCLCVVCVCKCMFVCGVCL